MTVRLSMLKTLSLRPIYNIIDVAICAGNRHPGIVYIVLVALCVYCYADHNSVGVSVVTIRRILLL